MLQRFVCCNYSEEVVWKGGLLHCMVRWNTAWLFSSFDSMSCRLINSIFLKIPQSTTCPKHKRSCALLCTSLAWYSVLPVLQSLASKISCFLFQVQPPVSSAQWEHSLLAQVFCGWSCKTHSDLERGWLLFFCIEVSHSWAAQHWQGNQNLISDVCVESDWVM